MIQYDHHSHQGTTTRSVLRFLTAAFLLMLVVGLLWFVQVSVAQASAFPLEPLDTETSTPTETATATQTATATASATVTQTPTSSITPTPTATGTILPSPAMQLAVTPTQVRINGTATFTIKVRNNGPAPAQDAILSNSYPTFIDVQSVTTTKGSATKLTHSLTVNFGSIMPNDLITVTVLVKGNSGITKIETLANVFTLIYGTGQTLNAQINYSVYPSTSLPGTGELPLVISPFGFLSVSQVFGGGGMLLLGLAWAAGRRRKGGIQLFVGLVGLALLASACLPAAPPLATQSAPLVPEATATQTLLPYMPAYLFATPEAVVTLPSFPIPSPVLTATPKPGDKLPDTSPVTRVVVPAINMDAVVKYVPFETWSWYITGLREEVAWLGNTSWPGLGGNTALAGHVTVAGLGDGPFRWLEKLKAGDLVRVYTEQAVYTYEVSDHVIVEDTDMAVLDQTVNPRLTLITCTGWDTELELYRYRRVVFANLTGTEELVRQGSVTQR
jgi:LPXTG-site transpeptidase (sortase) family protein